MCSLMPTCCPTPGALVQLIQHEAALAPAHGPAGAASLPGSPAPPEPALTPAVITAVMTTVLRTLHLPPYVVPVEVARGGAGALWGMR